MKYLKTYKQLNELHQDTYMSAIKKLTDKGKFDKANNILNIVMDDKDPMLDGFLQNAIDCFDIHEDSEIYDLDIDVIYDIDDIVYDVNSFIPETIVETNKILKDLRKNALKRGLDLSNYDQHHIGYMIFEYIWSGCATEGVLDFLSEEEIDILFDSLPYTWARTYLFGTEGEEIKKLTIDFSN